MAALEDANPGFLKKVFGALFAPGDVDEIAKEPVLVLFDQAVEQAGIAAPQATSDGLGFIGHQRGKGQRLPEPACGKGRRCCFLDTQTCSRGAHSNWVYARQPEKDARSVRALV
jgi:hypothetical protein